jgi:hypothetical protein
MRCSRSLPTRDRWISHLLFVAMAATAACSFSVKAIDRPAAEFINANVKLEWLLTAQFLTAGSILVPFFLLLALIFHYVITGESRREFYRIISLVVSVSVAILCVEIVKVTFCRVNVSEYLTLGAYGFRYPAFANNPSLSSFPSEYGAISGTIAASLCRMIPSYRPTIILIVVILAGGQLITDAEFVSDILSGLAIGISSFLVIGQLFCVIESRCRTE